jgi:hypothetical protein
LEFGTTHNVLFAQASGLEFLGENAIHKGEFHAGLDYAEREFEIADKLHSRERRAWTHFVAGMCSFYNGDSVRAEREYSEGLTLAESIGELRVASLLKGNLAIVLADKANKLSADAERQRLLDEALQIALENFTTTEKVDLIYSRFEGHRCLAEVRFRRDELSEAERLCAAASDFLSKTVLALLTSGSTDLHRCASGNCRESRERGQD